MLIIVPSSEQHRSYLTDIEHSMSNLGAPITAAVEAASELAIRMHRQNEAEVFVTTVHKLALNLPHFCDLMSSGRWIVARDEFHRYAESNTWGKTIGELPPHVFDVSVSATPCRTDRSVTVGSGAPHVVVTLKEAKDEGAIRPFTLFARDYSIDLSFAGQESPVRMSLSQIEEELAAYKKDHPNVDVTAWEVIKDVRYYDKYVSDLLLEAMQWLNELNSQSRAHGKGEQHQMLVAAMGVRHAEAICKQLNDLAGEKIADWIGTQTKVIKEDGTTVNAGRPEPENEKILNEYKGNKLKALVQVRKASEGFDNPRSSVLVMLNNLKAQLPLEQLIGRILRRNYGVEPNTGCAAVVDRGYTYASKDHPGFPYLSSLQKQMEPEIALENEEDETIPGGGRLPGTGIPGEVDFPLVLIKIRDFYLLGLDRTGEETFYPFGDKPVSEEELVKQAAPLLDMPTDTQDDVDAVKQKLREMFNGEKEAPRQHSTTEKIKQARAQVQDAVANLAANVVRIRNYKLESGTFPKTLLGDTVRAVHTRWVRMSKRRHDSMTFQELLEKHEWVKQINNSIHASADPYTKVKEDYKWLLI